MQTTCDICEHDVRTMTGENKNQIVDGCHKHGFWAWMCVPCHKTGGVGFGVGKGQRFDVTTGRKLEG